MNIVYEFLSRLGIVYNQQTVHNFFNIHPYHPSLASIGDLFDEFNIENAGIEISKENFQKIPVPFIAKTSSSEGDFCLITKLDNGNITYLNEKNEFQQRWRIFLRSIVAIYWLLRIMNNRESLITLVTRECTNKKK